MPSTTDAQAQVLFDAGLLIAALLKGDPRHAEARPLVEAARRGELQVCTTPGILCEAYGALTWEKAQPCHAPQEAAEAVRLLIEAPSAIQVLDEGYEVALRALELAATHNLRARRIHDARHAATAPAAGVGTVYTYDAQDWRVFKADGLQITGPASTIERLERSEQPK